LEAKEREDKKNPNPFFYKAAFSNSAIMRFGILDTASI
jgi:hypothetical protein